MGKLADALLRSLASLKLAIVLLLLFAAVLLAAIFVDMAKGRDYARWYVYDQSWFLALLGLLALNILAAAVVRFPWKKSQIGFVITHAGLLLLLFGAVQTLGVQVFGIQIFGGGIEGTLALQEGETGERMVLRDSSRFRVEWLDQQAGHGVDPHGRPPLAFTFRPGPVNWTQGKSLDFGQLNGVAFKVTGFLAHARMMENWLSNPAELVRRR